MRFGVVIKFCLVAIAAFLLIGAASAQQIHFFPDFSSVANVCQTPPTPSCPLQMNGSHQVKNVLRLTDGQPGEPPESSTWFKIAQPVNSGFTTYFRFQIHNATECCGGPGDGLAFVIQNCIQNVVGECLSSSTDGNYGARGKGLTAVGVGNGGLGYAGIRNSLAIEFDTAANAWDPKMNGNNHVAVQGCGLKANGPVHEPGTYTIGDATVTSCLVGSSLNNSNSLPHLGVNCGEDSCADGTPHDVVIEYAPVNGVFMLTVWVDPTFITGTHTPTSSSPKAINIAYNLDSTQNPTTGLALAKDAKGNHTSAWVGFTAGQNDQPQQHDVLAWEFTSHTPQTQVQQQIPNGGMTATYSFGANDTQVTYFPTFVNHNGCDFMQQNGVFCDMTVLATLIDRNTFHQTRLVGTNFGNEQCVVYQGTGGNCVVYSITCQNSNALTTNVPCPQSVTGTCNKIGDQGCIIFSTGYLTTDGITAVNADYLKADPIGTNNWITIFLSFSPSASDPRTTGTGSTPSDFVATFVPGGIRP